MAYISEKNDKLYVDLDLHCEGQIIHFLINFFEHEYLANGLVRWNQILYGSCLGQGPYDREKKFTYILKGSPQGQKFQKFWGRDYLEISKSVSCQIWSAGSYMTRNDYLRTKLEHLHKLGDQGDF